MAGAGLPKSATLLGAMCLQAHNEHQNYHRELDIKVLFT